MILTRKRTIQTYDHRLRDIIHKTGNPELVIPYDVPQSTAHGWRANPRRPVVTAEVLDLDHRNLQAEVTKLRQQVRKRIHKTAKAAIVVAESTRRHPRTRGGAVLRKTVSPA